MRRRCIEGVRLAVLDGLGGPMIACTALQTPARVGDGAGGPVAARVDRGIGAVLQAGAHRSGPMGSAQFYDHQAEAAAAQSYGYATPFGPPGLPQAYPAYPAPGIGYGVAPAPRLVSPWAAVAPGQGEKVWIARAPTLRAPPVMRGRGPAPRRGDRPPRLAPRRPAFGGRNGWSPW